MPCYRCGARQSDPARGPSDWLRGVREQRQVLICPDCRRGRDWTADLDSCPACGSTALVRALGETACRGCGAAGIAPVAARPRSAVPGEPDPQRAFAAEVAAALDRVLGQPPGTAEQGRGAAGPVP